MTGSFVTFADVVHQNISFSRSIPSQRLILDLVDTPWVQRLRDISQTANTKLVYMFSEHSRFGHCLGVSYLAEAILDRLSAQSAAEVSHYRLAISAAALLHDIGHLAPGSHTAFKAWFPAEADSHEALAARILNEDESLNRILLSYSRELPSLVKALLCEEPSLPPWTWEMLSGGGWNVDRGNWCIVDSILAGVSYGRYNIPALTESITILPDGHLAFQENRLDAMMHFAVSRHAMYRQVYHHRVLLAADTINKALVERARDLGVTSLPFCDATMEKALGAKSPDDLETDTIFHMREAWWRYHMMAWTKSADPVLSDLSDRLINRRLFKTVRIKEEDSADELRNQAAHALKELQLDSRYYLHHVSTYDMHSADSKNSMLVQMEDGSSAALFEADPLFKAMTLTGKRHWLAMPKEAKLLLGRSR